MQIESVEKPWGSFRRFTLNEKTTVKKLTVNPGEVLSLQTHDNRSEFYHILKGRPLVTIGDRVIEGKEGDEFEVPAKVQHRIAAQDDQVQFLEISFGEFDENDIVRLDDRYGRVK